MKKRTKGIIAGCAAVAVLGGALAALLLTAPKEEAEESAAPVKEKTSSLLYDKDPSKISFIDITNKNGNIRIERGADDSYTIPGISSHPIDNALIDTALNCAATLTAETTIKEKAELSVYGLDVPNITVKTEFDSESANGRTVYIGNTTPKNNGYYVMLEGSDDIYTVKTDALSVFESKEYDFVDHVVYGEVYDDNYEDDYDPAKIISMKISRPELEYDIVAEYDKRKDFPELMTGNSSDHVLTSPVSLDLSPDKANNTLKMIFGLTAVDIAALDPDDTMLENFGLKEPACTVEYDINAGGVKIFIGNKYNDEESGFTGYYAMKDGEGIVYLLSAANVPWINVMPLDLTMTMLTSTYIYSLETIDVDYDGKNEHFDLSGDMDTFAVKWGGEDFSNTDLFKSFYQYILRAPAEELWLTENTDAPRITITMKSAAGTDTLEFITSADRMTVIRRNGQTSFRCRTAYVDRLIENIENLRNGSEIVPQW